MKQARVIAISSVTLLAVVGICALRQRSASSQTDVYTQLVTAQRGSVVASITPTGEVTAKTRVELSLDVSRIELLELNAYVGREVQAGDVLARIDTASLQFAVDEAQVELLAAEEDLEEAQNPYSALDLQKAEVDVALAESALEDARESSLSEDIEDATRALQQAKDKLAALQDDNASLEQIQTLQWKANEAEVEHGKILEGPIATEEGRDVELLARNRMLDAQDALETAKARAALDLVNAELQVLEAEKALASAQAGTSASSKVAQAEYNLARAQQALADILAGPDPKTVQLAQSRYDAARANLADAEETLASATMVAPFDGTITSVGAQVGDLVSSNTIIATLADLSELQILASVDETDISQVQVGQQASITFDAFSGLQFRGQVLEVPIEGQLVQNVVSYEVLVSLDSTQGTALRPGMTANVTIIVGRSENALLVPLLAIQQADEGDVVLVQDSPQGEAVATRVEVGLNDSTYAEILRGLNEGDQVLIEYQTSTQQTGTFRGIRSLVQGIRSGR